MIEKRPAVLSPVRLWAVARKEWIQLRRDVRSLTLAFILPVLLLVLFGYAIAWDIRDIPAAVVDQDLTPESRRLIDALGTSGYFSIRASRSSSDDLTPLLQRGRVQIGLVIPPGFAEDLAAGRPARIQAIVDGGDANTATIILSYLRGIVRNYEREMRPDLARGRIPINVAARVWYNEDLVSRNMIVPGLVAVIMMIIGAILTSLTIAREWERGTMEQLAATPVSRTEIILGKLLPYLAIGMIDVVVCSFLGVVLFGVPFRGSPILLLIMSFFFLLGALGLGIFISAATRTQLLATQLAMMTTFLPAYLLSGFMFSIDAMPRALQVVTFLVPARYFLVVTRGIFLKGVGVESLHIQGLSMVAFAAIGLFLSIRGFHKELR